MSRLALALRSLTIGIARLVLFPGVLAAQRAEQTWQDLYILRPGQPLEVIDRNRELIKERLISFPAQCADTAA